MYLGTTLRQCVKGNQVPFYDDTFLNNKYLRGFQFMNLYFLRSKKRYNCDYLDLAM